MPFGFKCKKWVVNQSELPDPPAWLKQNFGVFQTESTNHEPETLDDMTMDEVVVQSALALAQSPAQSPAQSQSLLSQSLLSQSRLSQSPASASPVTSNQSLLSQSLDQSPAAAPPVAANQSLLSQTSAPAPPVASNQPLLSQSPALAQSPAHSQSSVVAAKKRKQDADHERRQNAKVPGGVVITGASIAPMNHLATGITTREEKKLFARIYTELESAPDMQPTPELMASRWNEASAVHDNIGHATVTQVRKYIRDMHLKQASLVANKNAEDQRQRVAEKSDGMRLKTPRLPPRSFDVEFQFTTFVASTQNTKFSDAFRADMGRHLDVQEDSITVTSISKRPAPTRGVVVRCTIRCVDSADRVVLGPPKLQKVVWTSLKEQDFGSASKQPQLKILPPAPAQENPFASVPEPNDDDHCSISFVLGFSIDWRVFANEMHESDQPYRDEFLRSAEWDIQYHLMLQRMQDLNNIWLSTEQFMVSNRQTVLGEKGTFTVKSIAAARFKILVRARDKNNAVTLLKSAVDSLTTSCSWHRYALD